jgi:predicted ABC-type ATPase
MSQEEYRKAYNNAKEDFFASSKPSRQPVAIVLAGQPGAGKGILKTQAKRELADSGGAVLIDPDDLRDYRPGYRRMANEDYANAATRTHLDASQMAQELRRDAIGDRRNLVIDGTLRDPEKAAELCRELKAAGYEVDVRVMAVHERVSQRGVAERLEYGLADPLQAIPRDVPQDIQREAYVGMLDSVDRIEHTGACDRLSVYRRDADKPLYISPPMPPPAGQDARAAVLAERDRPMSSVECVRHAQKWDTIAEMAFARQAPVEEQERYEAARAAAHVELHKDATAFAEYKRSATPHQLQQSAGYRWASMAPEVCKVPEPCPERENSKPPGRDDLEK